ncbi:MAG: hypothetical protein P4M12_06055 [Gammaproteobacteria bacterium]|nr:hypothetical protein [Gammaproteobacteria bacterium]
MHARLKALIDNQDGAGIKQYLTEHPAAFNEAIDEAGHTPILYAYKCEKNDAVIVLNDYMKEHFNYELSKEAYSKCQPIVKISAEIHILKALNYQNNNCKRSPQVKALSPNELLELLERQNMFIELFAAAKLGNISAKNYICNSKNDLCVNALTPLLNDEKMSDSSYAYKGFCYLYGIENFPVNYDLAVDNFKKAKSHNGLYRVYLQQYLMSDCSNHSLAVNALKELHIDRRNPFTEINLILSLQHIPEAINLGSEYLVEMLIANQADAKKVSDIQKAFDKLTPALTANNNMLLIKLISEFSKMYVQSKFKSLKPVIDAILKSFAEKFEKQSAEMVIVQRAMVSNYESVKQDASIEQLECALTIYETALSFDPENKSFVDKLTQIEMSRGQHFAKQREYPKAFIALERAAVFKPEAYIPLIELYAEHAQYDAVCEKAMEVIDDANVIDEKFYATLAAIIAKINQLLGADHSYHEELSNVLDHIALKKAYIKTLETIKKEITAGAKLEGLEELVSSKGERYTLLESMALAFIPQQNEKYKLFERLAILQIYNPAARAFLQKKLNELKFGSFTSLNSIISLQQTLRSYPAAKNWVRKFDAELVAHMKEYSCHASQNNSQAITGNYLAVASNVFGKARENILRQVNSSVEENWKYNGLAELDFVPALIERAAFHGAKRQVRRSVSLYGMAFIKLCMDEKTLLETYQLTASDVEICSAQANYYIQDVIASETKYSKYAQSWIALKDIIATHQIPVADILEQHDLVPFIANVAKKYSSSVSKDFMDDFYWGYCQGLELDEKVAKKNLEKEINLYSFNKKEPEAVAASAMPTAVSDSTSSLLDFFSSTSSSSTSLYPNLSLEGQALTPSAPTPEPGISPAMSSSVMLSASSQSFFPAPSAPAMSDDEFIESLKQRDNQLGASVQVEEKAAQPEKKMVLS